MSQLVRVTSSGQVTIPIEMRKRLKILKGAYLSIEIQGKVIHIKKI